MSEATARVRIRGRFRLHIRVIAHPSLNLPNDDLVELSEHLGDEARAWLARRELDVDSSAGGER